jgi:predicted nucleic acid-binding protein
MIAIDANLLIYATLANSPKHTDAKAWLASVLDGNETVGIPWSSIHAFFRLTTGGVISDVPMPIREAVSLIDHGSPTRMSC